MTRTFILYSHGTTSPTFDLSRLYESGRLDLVCRCVLATLWLSSRVRKDSQILISLNGGPKPPVAIRFDGAKIVGINPSERDIAEAIRRCLYKVKDANWTAIQDGVSVSRKSFQDLIKEARNVFVLDAKGEQIEKLNLESPTLVLGDNLGIPTNEMKFALRKGKKVSLGNQIYLASAVISVVNWVLDK